ncbi:MAG: nickel-responsive transcriptional regulator NikR [Candidatus Hermodarchaeota archaeon]|nr:nickel-responsive transcriptional regulator NikR [Candidatus Hermodarchaeota archaeon]
MVKPGVARISISLPPTLLENFDQVTSNIGYDRSKAIQQAMRDFITEYQWEYDPLTRLAGTITFIYSHEVPGLETELTAIQHQFPKTISSTTHIHLDHHCLLVVVVNGPAKEIKVLASKLQSLRGIHQLKITSLMVE